MPPDPTRHIPTQDEVNAQLWGRRNWGRWGDDDERGAVNLITPAKRAQAVALVQSGETLSLSRPLPTHQADTNPKPAQHYTMWGDRNLGWGAASDFYGIEYHGHTTTHIDALSHIWGPDGLYNGRDPSHTLTPRGARKNDVAAFRDGIITRGVLLDVARHRGVDFVTHDEPVHGWELEAIAQAQGVTLEPGDALLVCSGREAFYASQPNKVPGRPPLPGLHATCLPFIRDNDVALLVWDLMDLKPSGYELDWGVHGVIPAYGVPLLDNALLEPLADRCNELARYTFLLMVLPLVVTGGTGSPVNPVVMF
ncbi:MAG: putative cyclase [Chloroflexi bacterium]|nr:MAG: putative cyclase [Chloroflexota bacterium]